MSDGEGEGDVVLLGSSRQGAAAPPTTTARGTAAKRTRAGTAAAASAGATDGAAAGAGAGAAAGAGAGAGADAGAGAAAGPAVIVLSSDDDEPPPAPQPRRRRVRRVSCAVCLDNDVPQAERALLFCGHCFCKTVRAPALAPPPACSCCCRTRVVCPAHTTPDTTQRASPPRCSQCIGGTIKAAVDDFLPQGHVLCPDVDCRRPLTGADIDAHVDAATAALFHERALSKLVSRSAEDGLGCCPSAGCSYLFAYDAEHHLLDCPLCRKRYCMACPAPPSPPPQFLSSSAQQHGASPRRVRRFAGVQNGRPPRHPMRGERGEPQGRRAVAAGRSRTVEGVPEMPGACEPARAIVTPVPAFALASASPCGTVQPGATPRRRRGWSARAAATPCAACVCNAFVTRAA